MTQKTLHWDEEDTLALEQFKTDLAAGKVETVVVTRENLREIINREA